MWVGSVYFISRVLHLVNCIGCFYTYSVLYVGILLCHCVLLTFSHIIQILLVYRPERATPLKKGTWEGLHMISQDNYKETSVAEITLNDCSVILFW